MVPDLLSGINIHSIFISQLTGISLGRQMYAIYFHTTISVPTSPFYNIASKITVIYVGTRIFFQFKPASSYLPTEKTKKKKDRFLAFLILARKLKCWKMITKKTFFLDFITERRTIRSSTVHKSRQGVMSYSICVYSVYLYLLDYTPI